MSIATIALVLGILWMFAYMYTKDTFQVVVGNMFIATSFILTKLDEIAILIKEIK